MGPGDSVPTRLFFFREMTTIQKGTGSQVMK